MAISAGPGITAGDQFPGVDQFPAVIPTPELIQADWAIVKETSDDHAHIAIIVGMEWFLIELGHGREGGAVRSLVTSAGGLAESSAMRREVAPAPSVRHEIFTFPENTLRQRGDNERLPR